MADTPISAPAPAAKAPTIAPAPAATPKAAPRSVAPKPASDTGPKPRRTPSSVSAKDALKLDKRPAELIKEETAKARDHVAKNTPITGELPATPTPSSEVKPAAEPKIETP